MNERDKILSKIKKCLALSKSSNEHEAEAALRQARKLMEAHQLSELDVEASQAEELYAKAGAKVHPANWESTLAEKIATAFNCQILFWTGSYLHDGKWSFIGCDPGPQVAQYAFTVLYRQAKRARNEHIKSRLKRCKVATKTRRADLFSEGWVDTVTRTITAFAGTDQQSTAIAAYMKMHHPSIEKLDVRDRNEGRSLSDREYQDYRAGCLSGHDARLNHGVTGPKGQTLIGSEV